MYLYGMLYSANMNVIERSHPLNVKWDRLKKELAQKFTTVFSAVAI